MRDRPSGPTDDELVARALSTVPPAQVPAGLADRTFARALSAPKPRAWTELLGEMFALSRIAAATAASVAAALLVVAFAAAPAAAERGASEEDAWIAAVLPFDTAATSSAGSAGGAGSAGAAGAAGSAP